MVDRSSMCTAGEVRSRTYGWLEGVLFVPFVLVAMGGIAMLVTALLPFVQDEDVVIAGFSTLLVGVPVVLICGHVLASLFVLSDARSVRQAATEWNPNPGRWAAGTLVLGYLALLAYVRTRHAYVVERKGRGYSRLVVIGTIGVAVASAVAATLVGLVGSLRVAAISIGLGAVAAGLLPVAAYRDAAYVRLHSADWQPNPGTYTVLGLLFLPVAALAHPVLGGYYLYKRRSAF